MSSLLEIGIALKLAGSIMIPLSILAVLALAVMLEKIWLFSRFSRLPDTLLNLVETFDFSWQELDLQIRQLPVGHYFQRFFSTVLQNRLRPVWWVESRAADEAQRIEQELGRRLWILETVVTAAPLLGLLGTILGMMHAFQMIGGHGLVNPTGVTGGVAQALIATAVGLMIALVCLFGFNYFSRLQSQTMDTMERLGSRILDHIRMDQQHGNPEG